MKKLPFIFAVVSMSLVSVSLATEQGTVDHCTAIIGDFRQMPEKAIPRDVLRHAKGLAIMTVVKAGFIFSGKGGKGVVVARTGHGWSAEEYRKVSQRARARLPQLTGRAPRVSRLWGRGRLRWKGPTYDIRTVDP